MNGAKPKGGTPTHILPKTDEIEKNWTKGVYVSDAPLDRPMTALF